MSKHNLSSPKEEIIKSLVIQADLNSGVTSACDSSLSSISNESDLVIKRDEELKSKNNSIVLGEDVSKIPQVNISSSSYSLTSSIPSLMWFRDIQYKNYIKFCDLGKLYFYCGDYFLSISYFLKAKEIDAQPSEIDSYIVKGCNKLVKQYLFSDHGIALEYMKLSIEHDFSKSDENKANFYYMLGAQSYYFENYIDAYKDFKIAKEMCNDFLNIDKFLSQTCFSLSCQFYKNGDQIRAMEEFYRAGEYKTLSEQKNKFFKTIYYMDYPKKANSKYCKSIETEIRKLSEENAKLKELYPNFHGIDYIIKSFMPREDDTGLAKANYSRDSSQLGIKLRDKPKQTRKYPDEFYENNEKEYEVEELQTKKIRSKDKSKSHISSDVMPENMETIMLNPESNFCQLDCENSRINNDLFDQVFHENYDNPLFNSDSFERDLLLSLSDND